MENGNVEINFKYLSEKYPDFKSAWDILSVWFDVSDCFLIEEFTTYLHKRNYWAIVVECIVALQIMVEEGMLSYFYKIKDKGGNILPGEYKELEDIPDDPKHFDLTGGFRLEN